MQEIRSQGRGSNFTVIDPQDGYRQNGQVWFGTCNRCGERVTSSRHDNGTWMHRLVVEKGNPPSVGGRGDTTRPIDYCPA